MPIIRLGGNNYNQPGSVEMRIFESLKIVEAENKPSVLVCGECEYVLCPVTDNYKRYALKHDSPQSKGQPSYFKPSDQFVLREYYCPNCGTLLEVDVLSRTDSDKEESDIPSVILF